MSEIQSTGQQPLLLNPYTSQVTHRQGLDIVNHPEGVVLAWKPEPGFDPKACADANGFKKLNYQTSTDMQTGETDSLVSVEMTHEEYEEFRQRPHIRTMELPAMAPEGTGNTLGKLTFMPPTGNVRAEHANPAELPPEDAENPEAPPGERTSKKLEELKAQREAINKQLINPDAADEYVRFADLHQSANGLIGQIKGEPGTLADYAAQGTRGLLGFAKDALVGVGELVYEGGKKAIDLQQSMLTPAGIQGQVLDAQILMEEMRLGNITTDTITSDFTNTATSVGKALVAPVTKPWAEGQYVESVTRGITEIATLPLAVFKANKVAKVGETAGALSDVNKATQAMETAQDANTAVKSAEAISKTDDTAKAADAIEISKPPEPQGPNGNGGKIKQKIKKLREQYLGRTPGKKSRTGKEVQDRMREEGKLRDGEDGIEFKSSDGEWYPLRDADMAHHPKDAVSWWNETGRQYGAKSPEVRKWMLDSKNYTLEHYSSNRSAGAKLTENYLPPLK